MPLLLYLPMIIWTGMFQAAQDEYARPANAKDKEWR